jgi:hypothetical protein
MDDPMIGRIDNSQANGVIKSSTASLVVKWELDGPAHGIWWSTDHPTMSRKARIFSNASWGGWIICMGFLLTCLMLFEALEAMASGYTLHPSSKLVFTSKSLS